MEYSEYHKVLVFGATSAIAHGTCKVYAAKGSSFVLTGRDEYKLTIIKNDLLARGARDVEILVIDVYEYAERMQEIFCLCEKSMNGIDIAYIAFGHLTDQNKSQEDLQYLLDSIYINFSSQAVILNSVANYLVARKKGTIVCISSVAGDRGRQSNYTYGSCKAGISSFLQGLRQRLYKSGVHVLTVKPGFVATPMTSHLPQNILFANADYVGKLIFLGIEKKKNEIYTPSFWRFILFIIKHLPNFIFNRLKL